MARLRLKELAEAKGMNISQVQRQSGLDMGLIRRYWYNDTGEVRLAALDVLAELLGVKPSELLTDEGDGASSEEKAKGKIRTPILVGMQPFH